MSTTVAIPAEIVGDTETLHRRQEDIDRDLLAAAICVGRYVGTATERGHVERVVDLTADRDRIAAELHRRYEARRLAYDIQPGGRWPR